MRTLVRGGSIVLLVLGVVACGTPEQAPPLKELQRTHSGMLDIVLLSAGDGLRQGKGSFVVEFRGAGGQLVDVGLVNVNAMMPMAGMAPMFGESSVTPTDTKGRYEVTSELSMAGTWRISVEWNGPAGRGAASLPGTVL